MAGVVGSRRDLIFVISELYYEVGGRHFVVGGKITCCRHILTGLRKINNNKNATGQILAQILSVKSFCTSYKFFWI